MIKIRSKGFKIFDERGKRYVCYESHKRERPRSLREEVWFLRVLSVEKCFRTISPQIQFENSDKSICIKNIRDTI